MIPGRLWLTDGGIVVNVWQKCLTLASRLCVKCLFFFLCFFLFLCLVLQASLNKLMETLGQSEPYFVKCIRSNAEKVQWVSSRLRPLDCFGLVFKAFFISFWSLNFSEAVYHFPSSSLPNLRHLSLLPFSVILLLDSSSSSSGVLFRSCPWGLMITWCWGSCGTQVCWRRCASGSQATTSSTASR